MLDALAFFLFIELCGSFAGTSFSEGNHCTLGDVVYAIEAHPNLLSAFII